MVDDIENELIPYVEFADNANERTPCVLVLDCSGSMRGEPIKQLNAGLKALEKELKDDIDASSRVQLLIIKAFGKDEAEINAMTDQEIKELTYKDMVFLLLDVKFLNAMEGLQATVEMF